MPGWALLDYNLSAAAAGATNSDMSAVPDPDFSQRNGHYIFTEPYRLFCDLPIGASLTTGRYQVPTWNAVSEYDIFQVNRSATVPSNPQGNLYWPYQPDVPINEEFQVQLSNNLGSSTEIENCAIVLTTTDWSANLPRGQAVFTTKATATITPVANAWSGPNTLTFTQSLRGGVYAMVGAACQGANSHFFRIIFPRYRLYNGRKLRPGWLCQAAVGNLLTQNLYGWPMNLGEWGRFHTFELPQIEVLGINTTQTTYTLFMWLVYLGADLSQLNQGLGGGGMSI